MQTCDAHPEQPAHADAQWTSDALGTQTASLCGECLKRLWEMLNPLLQTNRSTIRIDQPAVIKAGSI